MIDFEPPLSPEGERRRGEILALAITAARRRRTRRVVARRSIIAVIVVLAGFFLLPRHRADSLRIAVPVTVRLPLPRALPADTARSTNPVVEVVASHVIFIATDPTILDRLRINSSADRPRWKMIGDRELLDDMAAAGQPAGMIKLKDRVVLIARSQ